MSKKAKSSKKKAKRQRISVRDQIKASKSSKSSKSSGGGSGGGGGSGDIESDPIGALDSEWFKTAREADKWKPKWECMQTLMEYACGDVHGNHSLPQKFDDNKNAIDVITIFAKWLNDENHIFTRQHILKLLIPFGNTYSKSQWKKANKLAEGLIIKQWQEKKHGFLPLVTPALISVYIASGAQLKKWKEYLIQSMDSPQGQVRMSCWDFLAKICILSKQDSKLKTRGPKDVELFINDSKIIQYLKNTILNDKEKDVRESCAKFIYGAKQICNKVSILESAYKEILNDKRASMALDIAADLFNNDKTLLSGGKVSNDVISKKVEKKQLKQKKKQASSRKNNMRAMIARAKKEAEKKGGGGVIQIAAVGGAKIDNDNDDDDEPEPPKKNKKKKDKDKDKGKKRGGMQALMKKYKEQSKKSKANIQESDDDEEEEEEEESDHDDDNKSEDSESSASSEDSEMERRKEREKKKKDRERQRRDAAKKREEKRKQIEREKEKERLRKKKEKEEDRKRKEREKRERERKEKKEKKQKYKMRDKKRKKRRYGTDSDSDSDSESNSERDAVSDSNTNSEDNENDSDGDDDDNNNPRYSKRRNNKAKSSRHTSSRNGRNLNESRTETIDDLSSTAKTSKTSKTELLALSKKVDAISNNVELLQTGMNGMERKMSDIAKNSESKSGMSTKTEEKIMKILAQLQKDVKIMKNDISYIKACWEDAESIPSDE